MNGLPGIDMIGLAKKTIVRYLLLRNAGDLFPGPARNQSETMSNKLRTDITTITTSNQ